MKKHFLIILCALMSYIAHAQNGIKYNVITSGTGNQRMIVCQASDIFSVDYATNSMWDVGITTTWKANDNNVLLAFRFFTSDDVIFNDLADVLPTYEMLKKRCVFRLSDGKSADLPVTIINNGKKVIDGGVWSSVIISAEFPRSDIEILCKSDIEEMEVWSDSKCSYILEPKLMKILTSSIIGQSYDKLKSNGAVFSGNSTTGSSPNISPGKRVLSAASMTFYPFGFLPKDGKGLTKEKAVQLIKKEGFEKIHVYDSFVEVEESIGIYHGVPVKSASLSFDKSGRIHWCYETYLNSSLTEEEALQIVLKYVSEIKQEGIIFPPAKEGDNSHIYWEYSETQQGNNYKVEIGLYKKEKNGYWFRIHIYPKW